MWRVKQSYSWIVYPWLNEPPFVGILCLIPRTTMTSLSAPKDTRCKTHPLLSQSCCSFLNAWDNTQVSRAMKSVLVWNTRWRHGRSRGETKYSSHCIQHMWHDQGKWVSFVENFNFWFLTSLYHNFKMLHFDANPIKGAYYDFWPVLIHFRFYSMWIVIIRTV